ncbi:hypothetical protein ORIO_21760 (plasmid) [Cereibacter azotoformans]|uniref:hypothetical protein n=1 Tax=Cereibacter azotoformans TaxID=43057 RepID=UPI001EE9B61D|nr:hypothetical protein [Cereibacter azotoformans]ULB12414.1 hypothetical protein ORIO_21760 [Cereibacter azotoformans]
MSDKNDHEERDASGWGPPPGWGCGPGWGAAAPQTVPPGWAPQPGGAAFAAHPGAAGGPPPGWPPGWYYYGPEMPPFAAPFPGWCYPPGAAMPGGHPAPQPDATAGGLDTEAMQEMFEQFARGEVKADTIGRLLGVCDHEFWKGAMFGAAAGLLAANIPAIRSILGALMASGEAGRTPGSEERKS